MRSLRETPRHAQYLLPLAAALLGLGAAGCCLFKTNLVNTGVGVDLYGRLEFVGESRPKGDLVVAVVGECGSKEHCYDVNTVAPDAIDKGWHYAVIVPPGDFDLLVFSDPEGDGEIGRTDLVGRAKVRVEAGAESGGMMEGPTLQVDLDHPTDAGFHVALKPNAVATFHPSLQDKFFAKKWGPRGLAWPVWGLRHTDNEFLFGLGAPDEPSEPGAKKKDRQERRARLSKRIAKRAQKSKVQVLFVHGVEDTPVCWSALSQLDPNRYQPWFFFYPTGLGLTHLGEELAMVVDALAEHAPTVLVAHSMGGLVSRRAIKVLAEESPAKFPLLGYLSLGTPYGGMPSANGMNKIPAALRPYVTRQSLFDVQPASAFLDDLYQGAYPESLPFYLFYGTAQGGMGDGTVALDSATDRRAASRAVEACPYNLDHVGLLANGQEAAVPALKAAFGAALENIVGGKADKVCPAAPPVGAIP